MFDVFGHADMDGHADRLSWSKLETLTELQVRCRRGCLLVSHSDRLSWSELEALLLSYRYVVGVVVS